MAINGPFDDVAQFPHVARPIVVKEHVLGSARKSGEGFAAQLAGEGGAEVGGQKRDVFGPRP